MSKKNTLSVAMAAILALALIGGGCNPLQNAQEKAEEKAAEKMAEKMLESMGGEGVDVDLDGDSAVVKLTDSEGGGEMMFGDEIELPSDLEEGVIVYKDAKPMSVIRNLGGAKGAMVTLSSQDDIKDIVSWYESEYEDAGWTKTQTVSINGAEMRGFEKDDEQVVVTIGSDEDEGGNLISINYSAE